MARISGIKEHMEVVGADGVHVGTVDKVESDRIKLTRNDSGQGGHKGHHHYLPTGLVAEVEGEQVRLSTTGANALMFQEEKDEGSARLVTRDRQNRSTSSNGSSWGVDNKWLAVGAAAAATAGAALFARSRKSSSDEFELKLQTDENIRLISSSKVEGTPVVGRDGERLGTIENFMVDKYSGRVAYAVLSFGGTLGFGESLFPLPWSFLRYDVNKDGYVLNLTKDQLSRAPKFKPSETPEFSADYRRSIASAYRPSGR